MTRRIKEDHKSFRDVVSGRTRRELKRLISSGAIVAKRGKNGKVIINIPRIDVPHLVHGDNGQGIGRGPGKEGDVVGRDPGSSPGKGGGNAGSDPAEGINISIDLEDILKFMRDELELPRLKPKPSDTFEEVQIKYNDISKVGLDALRHPRRTMKEALKRLSMIGELDNLHLLPGCKVPMRLLTPINNDFRYRQFREIKIPSSNAVIFFARDCSGSMDDYRCDIVSDMSWWIDCWVRQFYDKVERCYFVHDTMATEVNEEQFYSYRYGGGTMCSSAFRAIADQLDNRFPADRFNVYVFYFTDGENWPDDNERMIKIIKEDLNPNRVNLIGLTQICPWRHENTVKELIDKCMKQKTLDDDYIETAYIGPSDDGNEGRGWGYNVNMTEEDRNEQIIKAIRKILAKGGEKVTEGI